MTNFRKRHLSSDDENCEPEVEEERRLSLEEVKFLQKQWERKSGSPGLAKKRGKDIETLNQAENETKCAEDELQNSEESSTQWTTGIAEVRLPIKYAIISCCQNLLQDKQLVGRAMSIPSSYSAYYIQLHVIAIMDQKQQGGGGGGEGGRRQIATDEFMLEGF
ncbi:hypothetical protein AMTRI_Chr02g265890 [Amborella trichopoda]